MDKKYDVIVIGGGASGMMSAIVAARQGADVLLLEKNKRLGEKLRITGGGRCNIWNEEHDTRLLLANYGKSDKFLFSAFAQFGLNETIDFFKGLGLQTKLEARNRAFPVSESAEDVVAALEAELKHQNVEIIKNLAISYIVKSNNRVKSVKSGDKTYSAKNYILATGGLSRPETGSTGDGLDWLSKLGHEVAQPTPTITPLSVQDRWVKSLSGTTLKGVRINFFTEGKRAFRLDGDILCTHFGISGPLILNNAYKVADLLQEGQVTATIDLFPKLDENELDKKLQQLLQENRIKQLKNITRYLLPDGTGNTINELLNKQIDLNTTASETTKEQRKIIVSLAKSLPLTISGLMGFEKAVVADGGLNLEELDTKTMQSKIIENLFVTGDLLNINRPSGGFSLQLCWTTGFLAGLSATNISASQ